MNERLIEVAEEIAKRTEDHMLHKGAEIGGLAFLSSFHAAITILSQIEEFSPEIAVQDDPDFDEVGEALISGMMPIYAASDVINLNRRVDDMSGLAPQTTEGIKPFPSFLSGDINPRIRPGAGKPANPAKWRDWQSGELPVPGMQVYRTDKSNSIFTSGFAYEVVTVSRDGGINICGDDGVMRFIVSRRVLKEFRPAV